MEMIGIMCKSLVLFLFDTFGDFGGIIAFLIFGGVMLLVALVVLYLLSILEKYIMMDKDMRRYCIHSKKVAVRCFFLNLRCNLKELFR